jgi:hypothetical protein
MRTLEKQKMFFFRGTPLSPIGLKNHEVKVNNPEEKLVPENAESEQDKKSDLSAKSKGMEEDAMNHNVKEELEVIGTPLTSNVDYLSQVDNRTPTTEATLNSENAEVTILTKCNKKLQRQFTLQR